MKKYEKCEKKVKNVKKLRNCKKNVKNVKKLRNCKNMKNLRNRPRGQKITERSKNNRAVKK